MFPQFDKITGFILTQILRLNKFKGSHVVSNEFKSIYCNVAWLSLIVVRHAHMEGGSLDLAFGGRTEQKLH